MISEQDLEFVVSDQRESFISKPQGVLRHLDMNLYLNNEQIVVVSGIRRCGKSTLLRQFAHRLENDFLYANFDDERLLHFEVSDFSALLILWHKQSNSRNVIMDEIQNIPQWERFVRRIHDEGYKVFLSGSNSKLLSGELGTHLSGRYKQLSLFPFSFAEYLDFASIPIKKTTQAQAAVSKAFDDYLLHGGFPLYCLSKDEELLSTLYENILYKDILFRYAIQEKKAFRELAYYAVSNTGKEFSYRNISRLLGIKSDTSTKNYLSYMEEAFLLFQTPKYDYSLKKQYVSNKKIYCIDNGLSNRVAFRFSQDSGRLLENLVFIELLRRGFQV
ncbi:MAG: ATP-binding protein, partial [Bacteroidia bacterium]|nr:ATP-binding protein [Bacteroidia bacterium]